MQHVSCNCNQCQRDRRIQAVFNGCTVLFGGALLIIAISSLVTLTFLAGDLWHWLAAR